MPISFIFYAGTQRIGTRTSQPGLAAFDFENSKTSGGSTLYCIFKAFRSSTISYKKFARNPLNLLICKID